MEPEDDEILVYDWRNASVPRLTGTTRLLEGPSSRLSQQYQPAPPVSVPKVFPNTFQGGSSFNTFDQTPWNYQRSFSEVTYPNSKTDYSFNYHAPLQPPHQNFQTNQNHYEWQNYNPTTGAYGMSSRIPSETSMSMGQAQKAQLENEDDDWFEIEEIDYSDSRATPAPVPSEKPFEIDQTNTDFVDHNSRKAQTEPPLEIEEFDYSDRRNRYGQSDKSLDSDVSTGLTTDKSPSFAVPQPNLPLNEVLAVSVGVQQKKPTNSRVAAVWNRRKRPRSELDKSAETSDLTDFLSKTKHRASARSYAKPTRRTNSVTDSSSVSVSSSVNDSDNAQTQLEKSIDDNDMSTSALSDISQDSSENQGNLENSLNPGIQNCSSLNKSIIEEAEDISDNEIEEQSEISLKIRTDIFENDEDDE